MKFVTKNIILLLLILSTGLVLFNVKALSNNVSSNGTIYYDDDKFLGVSLNTNLINSLKISLVGEGPVLSQPSDENASGYSQDSFGYLEIELGEKSFNPDDGFAMKIAGNAVNSYFRVFIQDEDGDLYRIGSAGHGSSSSTAFFVPFVDDDGEINQLKVASYCFIPSKEMGTLYFKYSDMTRMTTNHYQDGINDSELPLGNFEMNKIVKVIVAMDMSQIGQFARSFVLGSFANIDLDSNEPIEIIFDTHDWEYSNDESSITSDVNLIQPNNGKTLKATGKDFKINNWDLSQAGPTDILSRSTYEIQQIGDVKILDDFNIPSDFNLSTEEKNTLINSFYSLSGNKSYLSYYDMSQIIPDYKYGNALKFTLGDYFTEYDSALNRHSSLTLAPNTFANDWTDWKEAKGLTFYVYNLQNYPFSFNFQFNLQDRENRKERWGIFNPGSIIYLYDDESGEEWGVTTEDQIVLPSNFRGWVRIPFGQLDSPANIGDIHDNIMDLENDIPMGIYITSMMEKNSNASIVLDNVGLYYKEFSVKSTFYPSLNSIAQNLKSGKE